MAFFYYNNFGDFMKLIIGKYSGFCNGVKNTVNKALEELQSNQVYSLGEIVHNEEVVNSLKKRGLIVKNSIDDIPNNSKVIIRAHGERIEIFEKAKEKNIELIDLTCGRVKMIHNKILSKKNSFVIIVGKKNHPETIAHKSYCKDNYIIEDFSDIRDAYNKFLSSKKDLVYVVVQTTFNSQLFDEIVKEIKKVFINTNIEIDKTICNATSIRQNEVCEIAKVATKMIVIGGKNSSNTKELEIVARNNCKCVYLIQTKDDLNKDMFDENDIVGITAGASTPYNTINDVIKYLENIYNKKK